MLLTISLILFIISLFNKENEYGGVFMGLGWIFLIAQVLSLEV